MERVTASPPMEVQARHRGVRKRARGKFGAEIWDPTLKRQIWLGTFDSAHDAAKAYDAAALRLHGSNTKVNLPLSNRKEHKKDNICANCSVSATTRTVETPSDASQPPVPPPPHTSNPPSHIHVTLTRFLVNVQLRRSMFVPVLPPQTSILVTPSMFPQNAQPGHLGIDLVNAMRRIQMRNNLLRRNHQLRLRVAELLSQASFGNDVAHSQLRVNQPQPPTNTARSLDLNEPPSDDF